MDGQVVIISAPSGTGKSMWLAELVAKERMRGQSVHVCSAAKTNEAFLQYIKEHYSRDNTRFPSPASLSTLFGPADIFALEDVDIFLRGRENTQKEFAYIIVETSHEGEKIYLTGIDLQGRAEHFLEAVKRHCSNLKIYTSVKRSILEDY